MELSANKKTRRVLAMCIAAILLVFAVLFLPLVKFETTVFTKRSANTFVGDEKYLEAKAEVEAVCAKYDSDKLTVDESVTERTNSKGATTSMVTFTVREKVSRSGWALLLANFRHSKGMTSVGVSNAVGIMMLCLIAFHFVPQSIADKCQSLFVKSPWIVKLIAFILVVQLVIEFMSEEVAPFIYFQF